MSRDDHFASTELSPLGFMDMAGWATLLAALMYTAGWAYADVYFGNFRVGVLALDIPLQYYLIYGLWVFQQSWLWIVVLGLPAWAMIIGIWLFARRNRLWRFAVARLLIVGLLIGLFWGSSVLGREQANAYYAMQRRIDYADSPRVQVWLKDGSQNSEYPPSEDKGFSKGCYRLLLHNRDKVFLFRSFRSIPEAVLPVEVVSFADIASMTILPQNNSCEEE